MSPPLTPAVDLTHQRLSRAALELFSSRGYHDTTTAQIAKKAGVAEGTIYRHFPSKQQLLNDIYRAALRWAAQTVADASGATPRARLTAVAQGLVEGAVRDPAVVKLGLLERHDTILDDDSRRAAREFRMGIERVIAQGKADGSVRAGAVDVWAGVWLAAVGYALEKIVAKEWKTADAGIGLVIEGAWAALSSSP